MMQTNEEGILITLVKKKKKKKYVFLKVHYENVKSYFIKMHPSISKK